MRGFSAKRAKHWGQILLCTAAGGLLGVTSVYAARSHPTIQVEYRSAVTTATSTTTGPTTTTVPPSTTTSADGRTTTTRASRSARLIPVVPIPTTVSAFGYGHSQSGVASFYQQPRGWKPAGCAHRTLPKGTRLEVRNVANNKTTTCIVNDRGPYISGRIIDLDTEVYDDIAPLSSGVCFVVITTL